MKSSAKEIAFDQHFQHALQGGIDKLAGDALAKAVKLILYFQYKEGKRIGVFENLFFRRELPLKCFDVEQRAVVAIELKTCLITSVALQVLMLHNWWSYASSLAPTIEPSTTLLLSTKEGLVQKPSPQAVLAQLISHLPSKNDKFTLRSFHVTEAVLVTEYLIPPGEVTVTEANVSDEEVGGNPPGGIEGTESEAVAVKFRKMKRNKKERSEVNGRIGITLTLDLGNGVEDTGE
ncbi:hypothetical protein FF2_021591 [Malus domestica]